jgi:4-hydroxy-2-oxoheptanedioate aldolase
MNSDSAYECIHTIDAAGSKPFIRVPIGMPSDIHKYLDLGAQGIIVPMVNLREEAKICAQAAKYPPRGERSIGGDDQVHDGQDYPERANRGTMLLVQIEHIHAVNAAEDILSVDGVDGCFVGPTDLALSMGLPRADFESNHQHISAIQRTLEACQATGKIACCNTYSLPEAEARAQQGYQCITLESDMKLFLTAAQQLFTDLHAKVESTRTDCADKSSLRREQTNRCQPVR